MGDRSIHVYSLGDVALAATTNYSRGCVYQLLKDNKLKVLYCGRQVEFIFQLCGIVAFAVDESDDLFIVDVTCNPPKTKYLQSKEGFDEEFARFTKYGVEFVPESTARVIIDNFEAYDARKIQTFNS